jgi:hypothetical protein
MLVQTVNYEREQRKLLENALLTAAGKDQPGNTALKPAAEMIVKHHLNGFNWEDAYQVKKDPMLSLCLYLGMEELCPPEEIEDFKRRMEEGELPSGSWGGGGALKRKKKKGKKRRTNRK